MTFGQFVFLIVIGFVFALIGYNVGYDKGIKKRKRFPWSKLPGTLAVVALLLVPAGVQAFTLSWSAVNTYTDNTAIEVAKVVSYNVERGASVVSAKQLGTSYVFTTGKGVAETFRVQAELSTGEKSAWSPSFAWTSPLGVPAIPAGITVSP